MADKACKELAESFLNDVEAKERLNLDFLQEGRLIDKLAEHIQDSINSFLSDKGL